MNYDWKVINAELFTEAEKALNQLESAKFEIVTTHTVEVQGRCFLSIVARKHTPKQDIRY
jgi:hypothetical protein